MMGIQVLGHFAVQLGGERPQSVPRLVARVGCILAGWPGEWVDRERLMLELWGERPPRTAVNTLQAHISQLRKVVGKERLLGDANGYLLDVVPTTVDAELFQETIHEAARAQRQLHLARAASLIDEALGLWGGTPYADATDPDLRARRVRLEEMRQIALEDRLECQLEVARDHHDVYAVIANARELVSLSPLRERRHVLLIKALAAANRMAEANAALEAAISHVRLMTAAEPSSQIAELSALLRDGSGSALPPARLLARGSDTNVRPLQFPTDEFVLARVSELLVEQDAPCVVLHAPSGTHEELAACIDQALSGDFPLGVMTSRTVESADAVPPQRGTLRIIIEASAAQAATIVNAAARDGGATLIITSEDSPKALTPITVDATHVTDQPLLRSS